MYKLAQYKTILTIVAVMVMSLVMAPAVLGVDDGDDGATSSDVFGINVIENGSEGNIALGTQSLQTTITKIINVALSLLGIIAVVIVLIGGFQWMTSGGNEEKAAGARKMIFAGIIGLAIVLSAWAIAKFVLLQLGRATNTQGVEDYGNP